MATTKGQRLGIWIIAGIMMLGTLGGFVAMMVTPSNEAKDKAQLEIDTADFKKQYEDYQNRVNDQDTKRSAKYYPILSSYASRVAAFDASSVKELTKTDLKNGEGEEVKADSGLSVYYIGWKPDGKIFDQSITGGALKKSFDIDNLSKAQIIDGWKEGLVGMKIGGVREITIPAEKAYKEEGRTDSKGDSSIPPNTPLKFIVMAVEQPEVISEPQMPDSLKRAYGLK